MPSCSLSRPLTPYINLISNLPKRLHHPLIPLPHLASPILPIRRERPHRLALEPAQTIRLEVLVAVVVERERGEVRGFGEGEARVGGGRLEGSEVCAHVRVVREEELGMETAVASH